LPPVNLLPVIEPIIDPILDDSPVGPPGFFANVDLMFLQPHLNSHLTDSQNPAATTVNLSTSASLGFVLSPRFEVGYRLSEQRGEFHIGYWFENADRTLVPNDGLGGGTQRERLNLNVIDFDWGNSHPFALGWPGANLRFNVGIRVATIFFDAQRDFGPLGNAAGVLSESASNYFAGFGPEAGAQFWQEFSIPGLAFFGRVSGADIFGNIHQNFSQTTVAAGLASDSLRHQVSVPMLTLQAGLMYTPPGWNYSRFLAGYIWEEFWQIGRIDPNNGDLLNRGFFLRAEINF
jgi:hypothetical protein